MKYLAAVLLILASQTMAQDYAVRDTDRAIGQDELNDLILDRDIEYFDGGISRYAFADARYSWTYSAQNGGGVVTGRYDMSPDGMMCIVFDGGQERCDVFVLSNDRLVLLTEDGQRFPVREIR